MTSQPPPVLPVLPPQQPAAAPAFITVGSELVPCTEVQMVVAQGGVSLDGGEMVRWKRTVVVTAKRRYVVEGMPDQHAMYYANFLTQCPQAVGIPYKGQLRMPQCPSGADPVAFLTSTLEPVKLEMRRQTVGAAIAAIVAVVIVIGAVVLNIVLAFQNRFSARLAVVPIVGLVVAVLLMGRAVGQWAHGKKVVKVLQQLRS